MDIIIEATTCKRCGSFAINPGQHGRDLTDLDLCDVCYWRKRAEELEKDIDEFNINEQRIICEVRGMTIKY